MPLLIDTEARTHTLVRAINDVLAEGGPADLTLRRIARASGVSTSSMLHHYGSREHLLRVAAHQTSNARLSRLRAEIATDGALAFLPHSPDDLPDARAWLAWLELWRSERSLERLLTDARAWETRELAAALDYRLARLELLGAVAMIDGLLTALCSPRRPMRIDEARQILAAHLGVHEAAMHGGPGRR